jgi:thiamine biosynthesis lipoprotein
MKFPVLSLPCCLLLTGCGQPEAEDEPIKLQGQAMGTTWQVTLRELPDHSSEEAIQKEIEATLERIESLASHWRTDTPVSRFNRMLDTKPFPVSPELLEILQAAERIHHETEGAFDVTVAPLVNLWGFGPIEQTRRKIPGDEEIENALASMGQDKLMLLPKSFIQKTRPDLQLDLSAIAKGYAIDQVAALLDELGAMRYLIELGGELRAKGNGAKGQGWQVGLEHPQVDANASKIHRVITLENAAMATSGNYRLAFTDPNTGQVYSHLIDPRTGRPVNHDLLAVSVIAPTAMEADAWATSLLVLGSEKGLQLAKQENLGALFVERDPSGIQILTTPNFPR